MVHFFDYDFLNWTPDRYHRIIKLVGSEFRSLVDLFQDVAKDLVGRSLLGIPILIERFAHWACVVFKFDIAIDF